MIYIVKGYMRLLIIHGDFGCIKLLKITKNIIYLSTSEWILNITHIVYKDCYV